MTIENPAMGEQPIFSCKAHVFHIDPKTKRSWIPASSSAVAVSFFYDSTRNLHRIISVEGTKAVINSTIVPNMTFTKTSQKFGQWSDVRANTVYGLGFGTEAELNKFIEKFQEIKEAARLSSSGGAVSGGAVVAATSNGATTAASAPGTSPSVSRAAKEDQVDHGLPLPPPPEPAVSGGGTGASDKTLAASVAVTTTSNIHQRNHNITTYQAADSPKHERADSMIKPAPPAGTCPGATSVTAAAPSAITSSSHEAQLKYENDRLKLALAQSSANAKKWEVELSTLKSNNARLTAALQESTTNVEEWKLQLQNYKEENVKLRARVLELESGGVSGVNGGGGGGGGDVGELSRQLHQLRVNRERLECDVRQRDEQLRRNVAASDNQLKLHQERVTSLELEKQQMTSQSGRLQGQLDMALAAQDSQHKVLDTISQQLADKLAELRTLHCELHQAIQS